MELSRSEPLANPPQPGDPAPLQRGRRSGRAQSRAPAAATRSPSSTIAAAHLWRARATRRPRRQRAARPRPRARAARDPRACSTPSISRRRSSARSRRASCRSPVNTLLTAADYRYILGDSRASARDRLGRALMAGFEPAHGASWPAICATSSSPASGCTRAARTSPRCWPRPSDAAADRPPRPATMPASGCIPRARPARPRARCTCSRSMIQTAELYAAPVLGIAESDVVFSAAKLFFAYGLGNALTFPMAVGATTVLTAERPTPARSCRDACRSTADDLLRRADALRRDARQPGSAAARGRRAAPLRLGRRGAARRDRPALERAHRRRDPRRASARPRCCTSSSPTGPATCATARPASRCRATSCASSTSTERDVAGGRDRRAVQSTARPRRMTTGTTASKSRATFVGEWTRSGDKYRPRRGRLLRLLRPHRRHAQGRRASGSRPPRSRRR